MHPDRVRLPLLPDGDHHITRVSATKRTRQLLEEAASALSAIKALLPYLRYEMMLFCLSRRGRAPHLAAYLGVVERQLGLLHGLKLSLRRIPQHTATHREFLGYIHRPLGSVLVACVAAADAASRQIEDELLIFPWLRQRQQQQQRPRQPTHDPAPRQQRMSTAASAYHRAHQQRARAATTSNLGDDLDALATIAETRLETLMAAFLEARLVIFFSVHNNNEVSEWPLWPVSIASF